MIGEAQADGRDCIDATKHQSCDYKLEKHYRLTFKVSVADITYLLILSFEPCCSVKSFLFDQPAGRSTRAQGSGIQY